MHIPISINHQLLEEWRNHLDEIPLKSPFPHMELLNTTLTATLLDSMEKHAHKNPDSIAVIDASNNENFITHRELRDKASALSLAAFLIQRGFLPGERATICQTNTIEYTIACIGVLAAGGSLDLMDSHFKEDRMEAQFTDTTPTVVIAKEAVLQSIMKASSGCALKAIICMRDGRSTAPLSPTVKDYADVLLTSPLEEYVRVGLKEIAVVIYSSGTTGHPKGVTMSHQAFNSANSRWIMHWETEMYPMIGTKKVDWYSETQIVPLPATHLFGFGLITLYLILGSPIVLLERFEPELYQKMIAKYKPRVLSLNPAILNALAKSSNDRPQDVSSLELILTGSTSAGDSVCEELLDRCKNLKFIVQGYGMSELCGLSHLPLALNRKSYKSIGVVAPFCEQMIMDTTTYLPCKIGQSGELWVRSRVQMSGYLNNPEETKNVLSEDGFLKTDNVLNFGVSPGLIENMLLSHPGIVDAAVIGMPDQERGEKICAVIVKEDPNLTENDISKFIADRMDAASNLTGGVFFVKEMPRSTPGKVQRHVIEKLVNGRD